MVMMKIITSVAIFSLAFETVEIVCQIIIVTGIHGLDWLTWQTVVLITLNTLYCTVQGVSQSRLKPKVLSENH